MVVVGTEVHKRTHTFVAVDEVGRKLGEKAVAADHRRTPQGAGCGLVTEFGAGVLWGIEDCRNLSARLERDLLSARTEGGAGGAEADGPGPQVCAHRGKSDPIDAVAVAQAVLREPDLPVAAHDEMSRELKLLVDRREDLVAQRTRRSTGCVERVHELDPARGSETGLAASGQAPRRSWPTGWAPNRDCSPSWLATN